MAFSKMTLGIMTLGITLKKVALCEKIIREHLQKGRLNTVDLLVKMGCLVKKKNLLSVRKTGNMN